ncbi:APG5-domain-containing protein [Coemansia reversa NRRL 1564]|uniref:Autophagy protein 5 n=1 Tax=Coemansia reversa (strain ATCC 12441 / NRRL 1564) TaxID=763665 RepID=A0A2G5B506_COERN|nr:APG5-domain-containing protein [Coemansia reversa NRRL 1564]|eukprot:PIA14086.1 APG5-domain-containing protein [Coemansia reversa NRRL 1564]
MQRVWKGMIPIELQLASADAIELLASAVLPEPFQTFYMLIPRVSYLPFVTSRVKERWLDPMLALSGIRAVGDGQAIIKESDIWFEYNGQPLKWHYPVGLLYDMLVSDVAKGEAELPWSLTLHVRKFPVGKLVPSPSTQAMRDMFMAMIKEADFIRNGSTKRVMDLARSDQMQLLDGLESHSYEKYFAIHSIIVPAHDSKALASSSSTKTKSPMPKAIPVRFYMLTAGANEDGRDASTQADFSQFHISQIPVPLFKETSGTEQTTVADAFRLCYEISDPMSSAFVANCTCLCQGIKAPWESPIAWLADNLFYADCFLHLVVVGNS